MKNFVNDGDTLRYTNATGSTIVSGTLVKAVNTLGWAVADIAAGAEGVLRISGKGTAPKVSAAVFAVGEKLIWDVSAGKFDDSLATPAAGDVTGAAIAAVAGANAETTCTIVLTPGNSNVT